MKNRTLATLNPLHQLRYRNLSQLLFHTSPAELLLQNKGKQTDTLDFVRFKSELQDSGCQTIERMCEEKL